ncbi:MAG: hypothetical protein Q9170_001179 [Blastenia crenularia]
MRAFFPAETRRRLREDNPRWYIKTSLQAICAFLAFLALILFAAATALTNKFINENHPWQRDGVWTDWMPLCPVLISLIYNLVALFLPFFPRGGKPFPPGWDVSVHLFVWVLGIPSIVFSVLGGWFWWWERVHIATDDPIICDYWDSWSQPCNPVIYTAGKLEIAANVFLLSLMYVLLPLFCVFQASCLRDAGETKSVLSFALFVLGCIATHNYRLARRRSLIAARNIQLQYHRSPAEHAAQGPPAYAFRSDEGNTAGITMPGATKYS